MSDFTNLECLRFKTKLADMPFDKYMLILSWTIENFVSISKDPDIMSALSHYLYGILYVNLKKQALKAVKPTILYTIKV